MANTRLGGLRTEPEFLIDTAALNRKYAARREDPRRTWTGTTQLPREMSADQRKRALYDACGRFIEAMRKRGWDLTGQVFVSPPRTAHDLGSNIPLLDKHEYGIRGVFRMQATPRPVRTDIPPGLVKRDPEHTITLTEAKKALS